MALKKEIIPWLKDNGYTWEDVDKLWAEACEVNKKCAMIRDAGRKWSDLHISVIMDIPTIKEDTLKQLAEIEAKKTDELAEQQAEELRKKYYEEHFEELMVKKIDSKEPLTERELERLLEYSIDRGYGEPLRWTTPVFEVVQLLGRFFSVTWYRGNTENQENEFSVQPSEVFKCRQVSVKEFYSMVKGDSIGSEISKSDAIELIQKSSKCSAIESDGTFVLTLE